MSLRFPFHLSAMLLLLAALVSGPPVLAQDFRGTITGIVSDTQGAAIPGASVTVTNLGTNVATGVATDAKGHYRVPYLISGSYAVKAELQGFKSVLRKPIEVRVGDVIPVDVTLETGRNRGGGRGHGRDPRSSTPARASPARSSTATRSSSSPWRDGTAYMLTRLVPGVADSSDLHFSRPMDNGNLAGIVANGALGGNDFTLDGAPEPRVAQQHEPRQQQRGGRLLAALGRDRRVQGPDQRVRRPGRARPPGPWSTWR